MPTATIETAHGSYRVEGVLHRSQAEGQATDFPEYTRVGDPLGRGSYGMVYHVTSNRALHGHLQGHAYAMKTAHVL
jgi:hypothetical protein